MPRGWQDYGRAVTDLSNKVTDLGELAARLGSPYNLIRSGKVIFYDTFDDGITRWKTIIPAGGSVSHSSVNPYTGLYSCKIVEGTAIDSACAILKQFPLLSIVSYGIDTLIHFIYDGTNPVGKFSLVLDYFEKTAVHAGSIVIDPETGDISIYTLVGGITTLVYIGTAGEKLYENDSDNVYHYLHLTIDLETLKYKFLLLDDKEFDLSSYDLNLGSGSFTTGLLVYISNKGAGFNAGVQLDNIIITVDEP